MSIKLRADLCIIFIISIQVWTHAIAIPTPHVRISKAQSNACAKKDLLETEKTVAKVSLMKLGQNPHTSQKILQNPASTPYPWGLLKHTMPNFTTPFVISINMFCNAKLSWAMTSNSYSFRVIHIQFTKLKSLSIQTI